MVWSDFTIHSLPDMILWFVIWVEHVPCAWDWMKLDDWRVRLNSSQAFCTFRFEIFIATCCPVFQFIIQFIIQFFLLETAVFSWWLFGILIINFIARRWDHRRLALSCWIMDFALLSNPYPRPVLNGQYQVG